MSKFINSVMMMLSINSIKSGELNLHSIIKSYLIFQVGFAPFLNNKANVDQ